jgi:AraC family transcriptional regulator
VAPLSGVEKEDATMPTHPAIQILNVGDDFGRRFRLRKAPSLLLDSKFRPQMAVTRLTVPFGQPDRIGPLLPERAFTISVHLRKPSCNGWGMWYDGKFTRTQHWDEGGVGIYDLEADPRAVRPSAFDSVHFNLPRATLDAFTADCDSRPVGSLLYTEGRRDEILFGFARFMVPWLGNNVRISTLTFDFFVQMFCSHVATTYGSVALLPERVGGLAAWQKRRVTEIVHAELHGDLRLPTLANECGLSISHFCRAFKQSFGVSVHRYVIHRRIEYAQFLLKTTSNSLAEIALQSGFCDQAAFSKTFGRLAGTSPRRWLNEQKNKIRPNSPIAATKTSLR